MNAHPGKEVGAFEAKTHFSRLLEEVLQGESITITRHGHPVAKLVPIQSRDQAERIENIERLKELAKGKSLGGLDWKELRDEGRKY